MKKTLSLILVSVMFLSVAGLELSAKSRYGIIGGINFSTANIKEMNTSTMTQYHAGLTYKLDLPLGFSLQPSLIYNVKGVKFDIAGNNKVDLSMGYLELPVSVQWGPDLLVCRPFLDVTPFIGYGLNKKMAGSGDAIGNVEVKDKNEWMKRFEYGLGLGVGLEIWRFQVIGRYNWNFGSLYDANASEGSEFWKDTFKNKNFGGVTLSVAFLFGGRSKK